jgi:hypothetical protein
LAALLEAIHQLSEPPAQNSAGAGAADSKLVKQATTGATLRVAFGLILTELTKHFGDLVPVLVARDREQCE